MRKNGCARIVQRPIVVDVVKVPVRIDDQFYGSVAEAIQVCFSLVQAVETKVATTSFPSGRMRTTMSRRGRTAGTGCRAA